MLNNRKIFNNNATVGALEGAGLVAAVQVGDMVGMTHDPSIAGLLFYVGLIFAGSMAGNSLGKGLVKTTTKEFNAANKAKPLPSMTGRMAGIVMGVVGTSIMLAPPPPPPAKPAVTDKASPDVKAVVKGPVAPPAAK
jgi:hypothetical protein